MKQSNPDRALAEKSRLEFRLSLVRLVCPGPDARESFEELKQFLELAPVVSHPVPARG